MAFIRLQKFAYVFAVCSGGALHAAPYTNERYCSYEDLPEALRQTVLIIDGTVISPEAAETGASEENQDWRQFAVSYLDASPENSQIKLAPRERVTVVATNAAGSGSKPLVTGCVPVFSSDERAALQGQSSKLSIFIGKDWLSEWKADTKEFRRQSVFKLVDEVRGLGAQDVAPAAFRDGALVSSLKRGAVVNVSDGVPRVVIFTDLSKYEFPDGDVETVRRLGFADGQQAGIDFDRAELHIVSRGAGVSDEVAAYLDAFFLSSSAQVASYSDSSGQISDTPEPAKVEFYQGAWQIGGFGKFPVRMRLATDRNGSLVHSWIEENRDGQRPVPISGSLTCSGNGQCDYIGDSKFAQSYSVSAGSDPECGQHMPFLGYRSLNMTVAQDAVAGEISDQTCFTEEQESQGDAFKLDLRKIPDGLW